MKNLFLVGLWFAFLSVPGLCLGAEFETNDAGEIQAALDVAASNGEDDTIFISAGTHTVDTTLTYISTEQFSLRIEGQGRGVSVLDGGGQVRVMALDTVQTSTDYNTSVTVSGVSYVNGHTEDGGGGGLSVFVDKADVIIDQCGFENNVAEPPEETYIDGFRLNGGGGLFVAVGELMRKSGGDVDVRKCEFLDNRTTLFGGGAYIHATGLLLSNTLVEQNVFRGNSAELDGGGLWVEADYLANINNTVVENNAGRDGGGIYFFSIKWGNVFNNIAWNNNSENQGGDLYLYDIGGAEYLKIFSNIFSEMTFRDGNTQSVGDNSDVVPLLDDDLTPLPGSPCINTGDNDAPEIGCGDFNDHERIHGARVDRGAIEFGSTEPADPNCGNTEPPITPPTVDGGSGGGGCFVGAIMEIDPESEAYKAAKRIAARQKSPEVQAALEAARQRVRPLVKKQRCRFNQEAAAHARQAVSDPSKPELLVFISVSMPLETTRAFAREAHQLREKSEIRFVLRGFPEGGLTDYLWDVQARNYNLNLTVDPFLYDTYEVEQVPAIVCNRAVKINHPRDLKSALTRIQAASDQNLEPLIRDLRW